MKDKQEKRRILDNIGCIGTSEKELSQITSRIVEKLNQTSDVAEDSMPVAAPGICIVGAGHSSEFRTLAAVIAEQLEEHPVIVSAQDELPIDFNITCSSPAALADLLPAALPVEEIKKKHPFQPDAKPSRKKKSNRR